MKSNKTNLKKVLSLVLLFSMIFQQVGFAQIVADLRLPGLLNKNIVVDRFRPVQMRYFSYDFKGKAINFTLDKGDIKAENLRVEAKQLFKYFLTGLTLPNESFWVNLRPDSENNIIDPYLERTDIGKVFLEADIQLKKDTARFTSPENPKGRVYWDKLYKKANEIFGSQNVTIPTLTRPWIVPGDVIVGYTNNSVYVYKAGLKVMLEQDHLKNSEMYSFSDPRMKILNEYSSQLIRELIIPELTKEVNSAKRYSALRQVFSSLVLAQWFKAAFGNKETIYSRMINKKDLTKLISKQDFSKTAYFQEYKKSFSEGEYNIKEPVSGVYGQSIRSYFSGGIQVTPAGQQTLGMTVVPASVEPTGPHFNVDQTGTVSQENGPDSRGQDGLPNDTYTEDIRTALVESNFSSYQLTDAGILQTKFYVDAPIQNNAGRTIDAGAIEIQDQRGVRLEPIQVAVLRRAIESLGIRDDLKGISIIFIKGQKAHYSVGRNQIFLDSDLLDDPKALEEALFHEVTERKDVLAGLRRMGLYGELQQTTRNPQARSERLRSAISRLAEISHSAMNAGIAQAIARSQIERNLQDQGFNGRMIEAATDPNKAATEARDPQLARIAYDGNSARLGWSLPYVTEILDHPEWIQGVVDDALTIRAKYDYVIFCGMGGSGLSVQVVKTTFGDHQVTNYSLRNTDPAAIKEIIEDIARKNGISLQEALKRTLVIPISKSGKTEETVKHKAYFETLFGNSVNEHMWVITDKGSPMDTGSFEQREIQLNGKGDTGGRYTSPTTRIFLLPLALVNPDTAMITRILNKAVEMNDISEISQDRFLRFASFLYYMAANHGKDKVTLFMPDEFRDIPLWAEQLFEESLGKEGKGVSLFYGEELSLDSLKPVEQNDRVFFRINITGKKTNQELWDYLVNHGYPVFEVDVDSIEDVGGVMLGLQRTVLGVAYLWDICAVDQPAVEGYKKKTTAIMSSLAPGEKVAVPQDWQFSQFGQLKLYYSTLFESGAITEDQLKAEVQRLGFTMNDAPAVYAAILNLLRQGPNFEAAEITYYGRTPAGLKGVLQKMRHGIFTSLLRMASKLGEGPDKNHSYHQNIQGGRNIWFSTYFMANELDQPEQLGFDDNLLKAQAIGTVQSLTDPEVRRKVVLIAFDGKAQAAQADTEEFFARVEKILREQDPANNATSGVDSSVVAPNAAGGIDFRNINIISLPMAVSNSSLNLPSIKEVKSLSIEKEARQLSNMINSGIVPSNQRMIDYLAACYYTNAHSGLGKEKAMDCLLSLFKLEEQNAVETSLELKKFIFLAESGGLVLSN